MAGNECMNIFLKKDKALEFKDENPYRNQDSPKRNFRQTWHGLREARNFPELLRPSPF